MTESELKKKFQRAWDTLLKNDSYLFSNGVYEVTICSKLAHYLQKIFRDYSVDIEYNKHLNDPKITADKKLFRPDILIHQRGSNGKNLLAIEMVKEYSGWPKINLMHLRLNQMKSRFGYAYALLITIPDKSELNQESFKQFLKWI